MIIEKKAEEIEGQEEAKETEEQLTAENSASDDAARKLELENAELRGKVTAFETISKSTPSATDANKDAWKGVFLNDLNTLDDESFQTKYQNSKIRANTAFLQNEFATQTAEQKSQFAELRAENQLLSKHADFLEYKNEIKEALADVSPEVRQDPERLSKVMERAYLAAAKTSPKAGETKVERKNITSGFEKPSAKREPVSKSESDEIPAEHASICKAFGITSEKERRALMASDEVETHFGGGIVFRDSAKGFEKVA